MRPFRGFLVSFVSFACVCAQEFSSTSTLSTTPPGPPIRTIQLGDVFQDAKLSLKQRHVGRKYSLQIQPDFVLREYQPLLSLRLWNKPTGADSSFTLNLEYEDEFSGAIKEEVWRMSSSPYEEIRGAKQINVSLSRDSQLTDTTLDLVATLYIETQDSCPSPFYKCKCKVREVLTLPQDVPIEDFRQMEVIPLDLHFLLMEQDNNNKRTSPEEEEESRRVRCISPDLVSNGRPNCQAGCNSDERPDYSPEDFEPDESLGWHDVQYLLTIVMAGVFFILCPVCVLFFLLYHRRLNAEAANARILIERQRAVRASRTSDVEVGVMTSPPNDVPPSYEDVHEIKTPPPSFEDAVSRSQCSNSPGPTYSEDVAETSTEPSPSA